MECFQVIQVIEFRFVFLLLFNKVYFISGYIPQRKFQLGNRYRVETDACLSGTKAAYEEAKKQSEELRNTIEAYPKTRSLNSETVVKHFLDYHRAYNPTEGSQQSTDTKEIQKKIFCIETI